MYNGYDIDDTYRSIVRLSKKAKVHWDEKNGKGEKLVSLNDYMKRHSNVRMIDPKVDKNGYIISFSDVNAS